MIKKGLNNIVQIIIVVVNTLRLSIINALLSFHPILGSIAVNIPACHTGDRSSIDRRQHLFFSINVLTECEMNCYDSYSSSMNCY